MPDIRQTTAYLDDFNRADENPLSNGGKWSGPTDGVWGSAMELSGLSASHGDTSSSDSYWNVESFDGDAAEIWGEQGGGGLSGTAWGLGLWRDVGGTNIVDGYRYRVERASSTANHKLYKYTNGVPTTLTTTPAGSLYVNGNGFLLIRRNGDDVEGWGSPDEGASWELFVSYTDTTYVEGLYLGLGATDNGGFKSVGWKSVGGGGSRGIIQLPQIIRRTHKRGGLWTP